MNPNLLIVILNYRTPTLTLDCLKSLVGKQSEIPGGFHVIVVENGSADGSAQQLQSAISQNQWTDWVTLMALPENLGFAGGNNAALDLLRNQYTDTPYALLLNSDTIVHPGALRHCHEVMQREPRIGVMSCQLKGPDGSIQNTTRAFPTPFKQALCSFGLPWVWTSRFAWADIYDVPDALLNQKRDVDWLGGAFLFLRTGALREIGGGLDASFFFYGEDVEFCFRFHRHGWRVHYDPAAAITHIGGSSSDPTRVSGKLKNIYMWQARYQMQRKCYGRAAAMAVRCCDILALALRKARMRFNGKRRSEPDRYQNVSEALSILLRPLRTERAPIFPFVNVTTRQPLRVLFALPGLHRINRGAEVVLEEIATRAAADPNFDVTIFGSGPPHAERPYRYRKLHCLRREVFEKFPRFPYVRDPYEWEELSFAPALFWNYSPADYDLTVTCGYPYTNWLLRRGRNGSRRPAHVFVTQNGDWMVQARNWEYKHFGCDALICTNPEYYARHKDKYPCALIPNGVDTARFHPGERDRARQQFGLPPGVPVILIVSALTPSKRVLDGIRAAAAIPGAHLIIAGDGEQRAAVDALGYELLNDRFRRMTFGRAAMPDLYRAADVLLHMSREEPFGNIYVEALASGLPIVAHESAVTRWILDDQATLIDTSDPAAVVTALVESLNDRTPEEITGRRALAENRYAWDAVAEQYCAFFRSMSC